MPSHFDCLGFEVNNEYDFSDLTRVTALKSEPLYTRMGGYIPWIFGNGIELWAQVDKNNRLIGMNPHFSGRTSQILALSSKYVDSENPMDGTFEAWTNPEIDQTEDPPDVYGDYPLYFDSPVFDWFQNLTLPVIARVQLAAFAHHLEIFNDEESYQPINIGDAQLASQFFIPIGSFKEWERERPKATAFFGGTLLSSRTHVNLITKKPFTLATIQTLSMNIDLLIAQELITNPLTPGQIIRGDFWMSGVIEEVIETFTTQESIARGRLFHQIQIAGSQYQDNIEDIVKELTFGDGLKLVREPENPHDHKAIAVNTLNGVKLGYIPRSENHALAEIMDNGIQPLVYLVEKYEEPFIRLIIRIYLPPEKPAIN